MKVSTEVFALRKSGNLAAAYRLALTRVAANDRDLWDEKALAWCLVDLMKRDLDADDFTNMSLYVKQLSEIPVDAEDFPLQRARDYVLRSREPDAAMEAQAKRHAEAGRYEDALSRFRVLCEAHPEQVRFALGLGKMLTKLERHEEAAEVYRAALVLHPANNELVRVYAMKLAKLGRHLEATEMNRALWRRNPTPANASSFAWRLMRVAEIEWERAPDDVQPIKRLLFEYLQLPVQRPSEVHSRVLAVAVSLAERGTLNLLQFARLWNFAHLREEDWVRGAEQSQVASLGERALSQVAKQVLNERDRDAAAEVLRHIESALESVTDSSQLRRAAADLRLWLGVEDVAPYGF